MKTTIVSISFLLILAISALGITIHVPTDQPTIQAGIDAAVESDTVLVAPGYYYGEGNGGLNFNGKNLVLKSSDGPEVTTINAGGVNGLEALMFNTGESRASVVEGFTVTGGGNGGIVCDGSSPVIRNNWIIDNSAWYWIQFGWRIEYNSGGGIRCSNGAEPLISGNLIRDCGGSAGGGIYCHSSNAFIEDNVIVENWAHISSGLGIGGGIMVYNCSPIIINNTIAYNRSPRGQIGLAEASPVFQNNIVAFGDGPGLYRVPETDCQPAITCCDGFGNDVDSWGDCLEEQIGQNGNFSANPAFCDLARADFSLYPDSPCLPENNSCGVRIGAETGICDGHPVLWYVATGGSDDDYGIFDRPFATIQHAVDIAGEGDSIIVQRGTYAGEGNRDINFHGKDLVLISESGPEETSIDCESTYDDPHRGFLFENGESEESVVQGFTVTRGSSPSIGSVLSGTSGYGGGVVCIGSEPRFVDCRFTENWASGPWPESAPGLGGAIYCESASPSFVDCIMSGNSAARGGVIHCLNASPIFEGCTMVDNAGSDASVIYVRASSAPVFERCLIAFNESQQVPVETAGGGEAYFYCTDMFGHDNLDWFGFIADQASVKGNMSLNPGFCNFDEGDYRIGDASPCLPDNNSCSVRIGRLGVGCNSAPRTYHVDVGGDDLTGDGTYANPFATIQTAVNISLDYDEVLVHDGTYTGDGNRDIDFGGRKIVVRSENGPEHTIIDCEGTSSDYHRGFYFHSGETSLSVVEGFTIQGGYEYSSGGGIGCVAASSPTIRNNIITGNTTYHSGSGIQCSGESSSFITDNIITLNTILNVDGGSAISGSWNCSVTISNNVISNNTSGGIYGSTGNLSIISNTISGNADYGILCLGDTEISGNTITGNLGGGIQCGGTNTVIVDNTITDNITTHSGGGISCSGGSVSVTNNVIRENHANYGGGLSISDATGAVVSHNTISDNSTTFSGGGVHLSKCDPVLINNTIANNSVRPTYGFGGGLYCFYANPEISQTIIAFNRGGEAVDRDATSRPVFTGCDISGNDGGDWTGVIADQAGINGNFSADPQFCDVESGNYHLSALSPCAATNNSSGKLIGALEADCGYRVCGDANFDGVVTAADIQAISDVYFGPPLLYFPTPNADMDCDDMITLNDIVLLAGYYYGYGPAPCCDPPPKRPDQPGREETGGPGH